MPIEREHSDWVQLPWKWDWLLVEEIEEFLEQRGMSPIRVTATVKGTTIRGSSIAEIKAEGPDDPRRIWKLQLGYSEHSPSSVKGMRSTFAVSMEWHQMRANHDAIGSARISGTDETRVLGVATALRHFLADRAELRPQPLPPSSSPSLAPELRSNAPEAGSDADPGMEKRFLSRSRRFLRHHWVVTVVGGVIAGLIVVWLTTFG